MPRGPGSSPACWRSRRETTPCMSCPCASATVLEASPADPTRLRATESVSKLSRTPARRPPCPRTAPHRCSGAGPGGPGFAEPVPFGASSARGLAGGRGPWQDGTGKWSGRWGGVLPVSGGRAPHSLPHGSLLSSPTVQPDPPANVTVTAVDGNPRWLSVTWEDPPSWNSYFYRLQFELRYRAERSKTFSTWMVNSSLLPDGKVWRGTQGSWHGEHGSGCCSVTQRAGLG